jgi:hypothetical protein
VLHGAEIEDGCLIGMGASCWAARAWSAVRWWRPAPWSRKASSCRRARWWWACRPRVARPLTDAEVANLAVSADGYVQKIRLYVAPS